MPQIADRLEKLGMSEYAQRFAENDIDVEVLSELTDKDFDQHGVSIEHSLRDRHTRSKRGESATVTDVMTDGVETVMLEAPREPKTTQSSLVWVFDPYPHSWGRR